MTASILKKQEVILLARTREVLEEILETLELQNDHKSVKAYREAPRDLKEGLGPTRISPESIARPMAHSLDVPRRFEKDFRKLPLDIKHAVSTPKQER